MYCGNCGSPLRHEDNFCMSCGAKNIAKAVKLEDQAPPVGVKASSATSYGQEVDGQVYREGYPQHMVKDEKALFVQENYRYYKEKWAEMDQNGRTISWNFAAFFLAFFWVLYRRISVLTGIIIVNLFLDAIFITFSMFVESEGFIVFIWLKNLLFLIYLGMRGNYHYRIHVDKKMENIKETSSTQEELFYRYKRKGGTNLVAPIILSILFVVIPISFSLLGLGIVLFIVDNF